MFTFRFKSYRIFQCLFIFVFVSSAVIARQTPKKCAEFNEYCLNHWDCCSNSCMSYMYRCTRGNNVYPYPFLGVSYKPTVTLDQILQHNFASPNSIPANQPRPSFASRFGLIDNAQTTEAQIVLQNSEENTSESTTLKSPGELQKISAITEKGLEEMQKKVCYTPLQTTEATVISSTVKPSCSAIGAKCYKHEECCSKRCHGFLHQCVT